MIYTLTLSPALDKTMFIDDFTPNHVNRSMRSIYNAGGKGINVSRAVDRLGGETTAIVLCGGYIGEYYRSVMQKEKFETVFIETAAQTRLNVKIADIKNNMFTDLNETSEVTPSEVKKAADFIISHIKKDDIAVLGGTLPLGTDEDLYKSIITACKEKKALCVVDTQGKALISALEASPYLIKPNRDELSEAANMKINTFEDAVIAAKKITSKTKVLVSLDSLGCVLISEKIILCNALKVNVKSTNGAGDTFLGGFLYALQKGYEEAICLKYAVSAASAKIEAEGLYLPASEELMKYIDKIELKSFV